MRIKSPRIYYTYLDHPANTEQLDPFVSSIAESGRRYESCLRYRGGPEQMHIESVKRGILDILRNCLGTYDTEYLCLYHGKSCFWVLYESSEADLDSWYGIIGTHTFIETVSFILTAFERTDKE